MPKEISTKTVFDCWFVYMRPMTGALQQTQRQLLPVRQPDPHRLAKRHQRRAYMYIDVYQLETHLRWGCSEYKPHHDVHFSLQFGAISSYCIWLLRPVEEELTPITSRRKREVSQLISKQARSHIRYGHVRAESRRHKEDTQVWGGDHLHFPAHMLCFGVGMDASQRSRMFPIGVRHLKSNGGMANNTRCLA